jgi:hypothetical protein
MNDAEAVTATMVERADTPVMFVRTADEPVDMGRGWHELEAVVGLRGRKFFGAFDPSPREYRVCVQARDDDDAQALGLESGVLPGGRYLRARLRGEPPAVYERIAPTFQQLLRMATADETRPELEFYRHRGEIDLLLPVTDATQASQR